MSRNKKLIFAAIAALAGGGALYAYYSSKKEEEGTQAGKKKAPAKKVSYEVEEGQEGAEGGAGDEPLPSGGGSAVPSKLCQGLDEEGNDIAELVGPDEDCPEGFYEGVAFDDYKYDAFTCYNVTENGEILEQEKDFTEVCGVDYPEYPFETYNDALLYAGDPEAYEGCTDPEAFNYDEMALVDDGSCEAAVEGCMLPDALNFDETANTPDNDSCEFEEGSVLGCNIEGAENYDADVTAGDGSCTFLTTCYLLQDGGAVVEELYSFTEDEVATGEPCWQAEDVRGTFDGMPNFFLGPFDAPEYVDIYLSAFGGTAYELAYGTLPCFVVTLHEITESNVSTSVNSLNAGVTDCNDVNDVLPHFNTEEEANAFYEEITQTQTCLSFDSGGIIEIPDVPTYVLEPDNFLENPVGCDHFGYFDDTEEGEAEAQAEFEAQFPEEISDEPAGGSSAASATEEGEEAVDPQTPQEEFEDVAPDCDGDILLDNYAWENLVYCEGYSNQTFMSLLSAQVDGTLTAAMANEALGSMCFDPCTGQNMEAPPPSFFLDEGELQAMAEPCGITGVAIMGWNAVASALTYPLSPAEANAAIGFDCFDENGEPVNPQTSEPEEETEEVTPQEPVDPSGGLVGDSGDVPDTTLDDIPPPSDPSADDGGGVVEPDGIKDPDKPEGQGSDDTGGGLTTFGFAGGSGISKKKFGEFVNSSGEIDKTQLGGCTDPIALNYNEGAELDDGSCEY